MAVVDELVTILGVKLSSDALPNIRKFSEAISAGAKGVGILSAAVAGLTVATGAYIRSVTNQANAMQKLKETTGISTTAIQELTYAAKASGLDINAITSDIQSLHKSMASPIPGQYNVNLAMLGVSARKANGQIKNTDELLLDLADKFATLNDQQASSWAQKLGISNETLALLKKGRDGIEELRKQAHELGAIIPEEQIKLAAEFKRNLDATIYAMRQLAAQVAISTIPALSRLLQLFKEWIVANQEWIKIGLQALFEGIVTGFERFTGAISKAFAAFSPFLDIVRDFIPDLSAVEWVAHLVTGALTILAGVLALLAVKFALPILAIVGLVAVVEDLFTYFSGGKSIIGDVIDYISSRWPNITRLIAETASFIAENFVPAITAIGEAAGAAIGFALTLLGDFIDVLDRVTGKLLDFALSFKQEFPVLYESISGIVSLLRDVLGAVISFIADSFRGWLFIFEDINKFILERLTATFKGLELIASTLRNVVGAAIDYVSKKLDAFLSNFDGIRNAIASIRDVLGLDKDEKPAPGALPPHGTPGAPVNPGPKFPGLPDEVEPDSPFVPPKKPPEDIMYPPGRKERHQRQMPWQRGRADGGANATEPPAGTQTASGPTPAPQENGQPAEDVAVATAPASSRKTITGEEVTRKMIIDVTPAPSKVELDNRTIAQSVTQPVTQPVISNNAMTQANNDNRNINITVATSDPAQAAEAVVSAIDDQRNFTTPGQFTPVAV